MKVEIAGYLIDCAAEQISLRGEPVLLPNRDAALLFYLLRHAGKVVDKSELRREVWGQRLVEDSAVHRAVSQLRTFFSDSSHRLIRTAARRGYMLVLEPQMLVSDLPIVDAPHIHVPAIPDPGIHVDAIAITTVTDHLATELVAATAEASAALVLAQPPLEDSISKPQTAAPTNARRWGLVALSIISCVFAALYFFSNILEPNSGSNTIGVQFATGDVVERNLLLLALIDAGRRLQPQVQFQASAETNKNTPQLWIALTDPKAAGAAMQFRFSAQALQNCYLVYRALPSNSRRF